jgi:hypothetical protein
MSLPKTISLPDPALIPDLKEPMRRYLLSLNQAIRTLTTVLTDDLSANVGSGTLVIDNGTVHMTIVVTRGKASTPTTGASTGVALTWT